MVGIRKYVRSEQGILMDRYVIAHCALGGSDEIFLTDLNTALDTTSTWTYGDHYSPIISSIERTNNLRKTIVAYVVDL